MNNADAEKLYDRQRKSEEANARQDERIEALTKSVDRMIQRWDTQWNRMWQLIYILVGALVALTAGPKMVDKFFPASANGVSYVTDIIPWHPHHIELEQNQSSPS